MNAPPVIKSSALAIATLYCAGLVQGIGFTTIPAAGNFLTSSDGFHFSSSDYGTLFIPMIIGAILASFLAGILSKRFGIKAITLIAACLNILSMIIFAVSNLDMDKREIVFPQLLVGMFCLGAGFGANLTCLNTYIFHFFPNKPSTALTALHSCLGIGTAIGPLSFNYFLQVGRWWMDPLLVAVCYALLLILAAISFPARVSFKEQKQTSSGKLGKNLLLWGFILIALLYGLTETTFGNWGTLLLHTEKGLSQSAANWGLSIYWGALTIGRIAIVLLSFYISPALLYRFLAPMILVGLILIHFAGSTSASLFAFGVAGLGCSAYLPLTISFGEKSFLSIAQVVSGLLMAIYMFGYGIAAEGIGLLHTYMQINYLALFAWLGIPVLILFFLCLWVTKIHRSQVGIK